MASTASCFTCGTALGDGDRFVLLDGRRHEEHCSESCLRQTIRQRRLARAAIGRRFSLLLALTASLLVGGKALWLRYRMPGPESISFDPPELRAAAPPSGPVALGPAWPPTDDDWMALFRQAIWIYPLPGPVRRTPTGTDRLLGPTPPGGRPPSCRTADRCAVDLGGDLWGEHVYAVHDGVVDRVRREGADDPGGASVRLAHFGGVVFTQYFHLAGIPRGLVRGARVKAGDVIGLLGDTGTDGAARRLSFALSVRPSLQFPEVYWDSQPWMVGWPLRRPAHGTVAGFAPETGEGINRAFDAGSARTSARYPFGVTRR